MAVSTSIVVINIGMAETERALVTLAGVLLFLLGAYGALHRRRHLAGHAQEGSAEP
jgi:hypothetical protein